MNFINNKDCWESTLSQEQDFQTMNQQIFEQAKYLSYGFFYDQVLSPAFEDIKKGVSVQSIHICGILISMNFING